MNKYTYFAWGEPEDEMVIFYRVSGYKNPKGPRVEMHLKDGTWVNSAWNRQGRGYWDDSVPFEKHRAKLTEAQVEEFGLAE